jgi:hypothetical protein
MGISIRAYARSRHISDTAVRKAIKTGRVSLEADGTIDPSRADAEWRNNTDSAQQRKKAGASSRPVSNEAIASVRETLSESSAPGTGGTTFLQARTANEVLKAQTNKVPACQIERGVSQSRASDGSCIQAGAHRARRLVELAVTHLRANGR